jgi:hypothetical protein
MTRLSLSEVRRRNGQNETTACTAAAHNLAHRNTGHSERSEES